MNSIYILKQNFLRNPNNKCIILKNNKVIFSSEESGITFIYKLYKYKKNKLKNTFLGDKIVGNMVALIAISSKVKGVYAHLISQQAYESLISNNIKVEYTNINKQILNNDGSDICPIEKLSYNIYNSKDIIPILDNFFYYKEIKI